MLHAQKIILAALLSAISLSASASVRISNLLTDIEANGPKNVASFELINTDKKAIKLELSSSLWTQNGNKEVFIGTKDLSFKSKFITIAPGGKKVVKVKYVGDKDLAADKAYRFWFSEILPDGNKNNSVKVVKISYRFGAGIFVSHTAPTVKLIRSEVMLEEGKSVLHLKNIGNTHFMPASSVFKFTQEGGSVLEQKGPDTWHILPNVERTYPLDGFKCESGNLSILFTDYNKSTFEIPSSCNK